MADERTHARAFFECTCIFFCTRVGADKCKQIRCGVCRLRRWSFVAVDVVASWCVGRSGAEYQQWTRLNFGLQPSTSTSGLAVHGVPFIMGLLGVLDSIYRYK